MTRYSAHLEGAGGRGSMAGRAGTKACVSAGPVTQPENCNLGEHSKMKRERGQNKTIQGPLGHGQDLGVCSWVLRVTTCEGASVLSSVSSPQHALIMPTFYQIKPHSLVSLSSSNQQSPSSKLRLENEGQRKSNGVDPI